MHPHAWISAHHGAYIHRPMGLPCDLVVLSPRGSELDQGPVATLRRHLDLGRRTLVAGGAPGNRWPGWPWWVRYGPDSERISSSQR